MFQECESGNPLKSQLPAEMNKCPVQDFVGEPIDGCECNPSVDWSARTRLIDGMARASALRGMSPSSV